MNLSTVKWALWDKTQSRELLVCSYVCAVHCVQLLHTILHRTDLTIFPLALQTITTAPMMSPHIWRSKMKMKFMMADRNLVVFKVTEQTKQCSILHSLLHVLTDISLDFEPSNKFMPFCVLVLSGWPTRQWSMSSKSARLQDSLAISGTRYCSWLASADKHMLRRSPQVMEG